jgi:hypothetical protein
MLSKTMGVSQIERQQGERDREKLADRVEFLER